MEKRYWAIMIKRTLLALVVLFCVGIIFDYLINDPDDRQPVLAGSVAVGIYLFGTIAMGFVHLATGALYLWLFSDKDMTAAVVDELRAIKLPGPNDDDPKNFDYLAIIADDESVPASDRVKAAALFGSYKSAMANGLFKSLALRRAIDAGILRYSQEAPKRRLPDFD